MVSAALHAAIQQRRTDTWIAFYAGYTAGTPAQGLSLTYLSGLYHQGQVINVMGELNRLLLDECNREAFKPILIILGSRIIEEDTPYPYLPYIGGNGADEYLAFDTTQEFNAISETSRYGFDALNDFCNLLTLDADDAEWDNQGGEVEAIQMIQDTPFEQIAATIGIFMRNCLNRQDETVTA